MENWLDEIYASLKNNQNVRDIGLVRSKHPQVGNVTEWTLDIYVLADGEICNEVKNIHKDPSPANQFLDSLIMTGKNIQGKEYIFKEEYKRPFGDYDKENILLGETGYELSLGRLQDSIEMNNKVPLNTLMRYVFEESSDLSLLVRVRPVFSESRFKELTKDTNKYSPIQNHDYFNDGMPFKQEELLSIFKPELIL